MFGLCRIKLQSRTFWLSIHFEKEHYNFSRFLQNWFKIDTKQTNRFCFAAIMGFEFWAWTASVSEEFTFEQSSINESSQLGFHKFENEIMSSKFQNAIKLFNINAWLFLGKFDFKSFVFVYNVGISAPNALFEIKRRPCYH